MGNILSSFLFQFNVYSDEADNSKCARDFYLIFKKINLIFLIYKM